ncbi:Thiamine-phosphate synthase / Hydroxymethylpyrimidine/phosphomethylpyrimidine kinase [Trichlorobacter ammonificans]|uniref:Thiamine-phosphate synthase n=1 Tax=Trichlorobacter ammonificans TaxID=2916410 RepID=A0ABM9D4F1_9BACT|nr:Thiamine-phosphate synthase / Hydroxymethylpyrimidine/phosphomethylpyrimidine kinase [Trichlorobacter ammonificans]
MLLNPSYLNRIMPAEESGCGARGVTFSPPCFPAERFFVFSGERLMSTSHLRLVVNTERQPGGTAIAGVYLVTDRHPNLLPRVEQALAGGVSVLQYRPKEKPREETLAEGRALKELCAARKVLFIVNDDAALAQELDADGVHLGQEDGSPVAARQLLGPGKLVGVSTHTVEEALRAEADGADYLGFGAMYPTGSKEVTRMPGTSGLAAVRERVRLPIVAIGGITPANACRVIDAGANAVAVISAVLSAPRPDYAVAELRLLFNRIAPLPRGGVLTVAGSDSGGGAGIQADLKTITLLGSYGASVLTALTAQNTRGVSAVHGLPPSFVREQLAAVLSDLPIDVIKTGMLHTPAIIELLAEYLAEQSRLFPLVVDPVMVAKGGAHLLEPDAVQSFVRELVPRSYLLTPNLPEAERLLSRRIQTEGEMEQAARDLHALGAANVLVKGGHLAAGAAVDILFDGTSVHRFSAERIFTSATHGTGCTFASAIATFLARGEPLVEAVHRAKTFISQAIRLARPLGKGHGPVNHYLAAKESDQ